MSAPASPSTLLGNSYVTGSTTSVELPARGTAFQATHAGSNDAFVTKLDPTGSDARVFHVSRRKRQRGGFGHRRRRRGQRVRDGRRRCRPTFRRAGALQTLRRGDRRLRDQARAPPAPRWSIPRSSAEVMSIRPLASRSTPPAAPTSRVPRCRPTSRRRLGAYQTTPRQRPARTADFRSVIATTRS